MIYFKIIIIAPYYNLLLENFLSIDAKQTTPFFLYIYFSSFFFWNGIYWHNQGIKLYKSKIKLKIENFITSWYIVDYDAYIPQPYQIFGLFFSLYLFFCFFWIVSFLFSYSKVEFIVMKNYYTKKKKVKISNYWNSYFKCESWYFIISEKESITAFNYLYIWIFYFFG